MHVLLGQEIREKIYKLLEAKKKKKREHIWKAISSMYQMLLISLI